jgi:hypothetical protein
MRFALTLALVLTACSTPPQQASSIVDYCYGAADLARKVVRAREVTGLREENTWHRVKEAHAEVIKGAPHEEAAMRRVVAFAYETELNAEEAGAVMAGRCVLERKTGTWFR